jgi:hypothetical protein
MYRLLFVLFFLVFACSAGAKNNNAPVQTVRGQVTDMDSRQGMPGVIVILSSDNQKNTVTDSNGHFFLEHIPVGRQSFQFLLQGYEVRTVPEVMVTSGKMTEVNVALKEQLQQLKEVNVSSKRTHIRAVNEFASVSSRTFNMEETKRYAAAVSDPARMAANFAGVSGSSDVSNGIVVRGNSPKSVSWRLEGVEIPNPNHYSKLGGSAGAISMLNVNSLGTSDFYTGAFPAEIGNALSGAFDLQLRKGNTAVQEHSVQVGTMGVEFSTEGGFSKGRKGSYLVNYRYSNPALLSRFLDLKGIVPTYQDLSFKLHFPTRNLGTFSVFGLGGINTARKNPPADSSRWNEEEPNFILKNKGFTGVAGVSHEYYPNDRSWLKTTVAVAYEALSQKLDTLDPGREYKKVALRQSEAGNASLTFSVQYNNKMDAANTLRMGITVQQLAYSMSEQGFSDRDNGWKTFLGEHDKTSMVQSFMQWKRRVNNSLTLIGGLHFSYLQLNGKYSAEPRLAANWQVKKHAISLAAGLHSKPEHLSTYLLKKIKFESLEFHPNKSLEIPKALHLVGGYEYPLPWKLRFKAEAYFQYQFDVPVEKDMNSGLSMINSEHLLDAAEAGLLVSKGTGKNYGIDLSLEKPLSDQYYVLLSGSLFRSTYTNYAGKTFSSRFDRRYQANVVAGKEFSLSRNGQILGLNVKLVYSGGLRESPIDIERSKQSQKTEYIAGQYFTNSGPAYFRADAGVHYKINSQRITHTIQLDVQNLTDRNNYYYSCFDKATGTVKQVNQLGVIPTISYRMDF